MKRGLRLLIVSMMALALAGGVSFAPSHSVAHGAVATKKSCKTVKKKAHGKTKKVKVCTAVLPAPTATATATPTTTPTPTVTPTATPSPIPAVPASRFTLSQSNGDSLIIDNQTNYGAGITGFEYGTIDKAGNLAPTGHVFLWFIALEGNYGTGTYQSSMESFRVQGADGLAYAPQAGSPQDKGGAPMVPLGITNSQTNAGWIEFVIPAVDASYVVLWNEDGMVPYTPFSHVLVAGSDTSTYSPFAGVATSSRPGRREELVGMLRSLASSVSRRE